MNGGGMGYSQIAGGIGETIFGLLGGFGSKPQVAQFQPINYGDEQTGAVKSDISAFPSISALGADYTKYSLDALNKLIPGYSDILAKGGADTSQLLNVAQQFMTGQLPPDVVSQIERSDAYQSFAGGTGGSGMSRGLTARDLGLTSIDLMKTGASMLGQGGNSAQQWAGLANQSIMNPSSMFITPQQKAQFDLENQLLKLGTQQEKFNVQAAPDPTMAGLMAISAQFAGGGAGGGLGGLGSMGGGSSGGGFWGGAQGAFANAGG